MNRKFDPSKAQIGPHANRGSRLPEYSTPGDLPSIDDGYEDPSDFEKTAYDEDDLSLDFSDIEMDKEALKTRSPNFDTTTMPTMPEASPNARRPNDWGDTDTNPHSAPADTKGMIKNRIKRLKENQVRGQEKEFLSRENEADKNERESFKAVSSKVDRHSKMDGTGEYADSGPFLSKRAGHHILDVLEDEDANPIRLMIALDQEYEDEWYDWERETIVQTAEQDGVEIALINQYKIMALKVVKNSDEFFENWRAFEKVCVSFTGRLPDWGHVQEVSTHDIAAAVALTRHYVREERFSDEVKAYIAAAVLRDGYVKLPPELSFAKAPFLKELSRATDEDVMEMRERVQAVLDGGDDEELEPEDHIQYLRLLRVQYHVHDKLNEVSQ